MAFRFPINFVAPQSVVWPELHQWDGTPIDPLVLSKRSGGILHSWILRTYYELRTAGHDVGLSASPRKGAINFVSPRDFGRKQRRPDTFLVIPQGDAHPAMLADFRIFQNGLQNPDPASATIWHWPQPGILPRDPARQDQVSHLAYKGRLLNLDAAFRSEPFLSALQHQGMTFDIDAYDGLRGAHDWNDYRTSDVVLAVRNLTHYDARKKPASKLVNAWFADVPALLGPEPPFQELRSSENDYLEVRTPRDALEAITALRDNPDLYRRIVEAGRKRRQNFTPQALTQLWVDTITGPITESFIAWQATSKMHRFFKTASGILRENGSKARDRQQVLEGPRLLDSDQHRGAN